MQYMTVECGNAQRVAQLVNHQATLGWRLLGPVVPVSHLKLPTTYLATMERTAEKLVEQAAERQFDRRADDEEKRVCDAP